MKLTIGLFTGAGIIIAALTVLNSPLGKHTQRWIWYSDARHTNPHLYSWRSLA